MQRRKISDRWREHGGDRTFALRLPGDSQPGQRRRRCQSATTTPGVRESINCDIYKCEKLFHVSVFLPNDSGTGVGVCAHVYVCVFVTT